MEQPQLIGAAARGKMRALRPIAVPPSSMRGRFLRREMRIENQRAGAARKMREREIDVGVSKLVVGRIHEIACRSRDAIGE